MLLWPCNGCRVKGPSFTAVVRTPQDYTTDGILDGKLLSRRCRNYVAQLYFQNWGGNMWKNTVPLMPNPVTSQCAVRNPSCDWEWTIIRPPFMEMPKKLVPLKPVSLDFKCRFCTLRTCENPVSTSGVDAGRITSTGVCVVKHIMLFWVTNQRNVPQTSTKYMKRVWNLQLKSSDPLKSPVER